MYTNDKTLVENFQRTKNNSYFKLLIKRYQGKIFAVAYRILGNAEEAEEIVQDTYIRAHQNLSGFRKHASFGAWIIQIARNLCIDTLRSKERKQYQYSLSFDPLSVYECHQDYDPSSFVVSQLTDNKDCPAKNIELDEESIIIHRSLGKLPHLQRQVIILHDIKGHSYQEIASIAGINLGTVRSRLHYGRLKLHQLLAPYFLSEIIPQSRNNLRQINKQKNK